MVWAMNITLTCMLVAMSPMAWMEGGYVGRSCRGVWGSSGIETNKMETYTNCPDTYGTDTYSTYTSKV
jgi:hypothetical protein